jgi:hypothetical protein
VPEIVVTASVILRDVASWDCRGQDGYTVLQAPAQVGETRTTAVELLLDRVSLDALTDLLIRRRAEQDR